MKLLARVIIALAVLAALYAVRRVYTARAKKRFREIDAGERCIACGATDLEKSDAVARCLDCGYEANLASLRDNNPTDPELDAALKPDRPRSWWE